MESIMQYLHNYFYLFKERGRFQIEFNTITLDGGNELYGEYKAGQYILIRGSALNDGVYRVLAVSEDGIPGITIEGCLNDENFEGYVCSLGVPPSFVKLCNEIEIFNKNNAGANGGIVSESFGGYAYTRAQGANGKTGWVVAFQTQLSPYRRMSDGFEWVKEVSYYV